jgi:hypothetical protein
MIESGNEWPGSVQRSVAQWSAIVSVGRLGRSAGTGGQRKSQGFFLWWGYSSVSGNVCFRWIIRQKRHSTNSHSFSWEEEIKGSEDRHVQGAEGAAAPARGCGV